MIKVGQDARGGWAWMILDRADQLVASGESLTDRILAVEIAVAVYRGAVKRREADLDPAPLIIFPDEA